MPAISIKRPHWIISAILTVAAVAYFGWFYNFLRQLPDIALITVVLEDDYSSSIHYLAEWELKRQIKTGIISGSDALYTTLQLGYSGYFDRSRAETLADDLLESGVDIDSHNQFGNTALHQAVSLNSAEIVEFLLRRCADPFVTSQGAPAFRQNVLERVFWLDKNVQDQDFTGVLDLLDDSSLAASCSN